MAYWWVCQNKTGKEEHQGGYLWAPHRNKNGQTFFHWENMDLVRPGDGNGAAGDPDRRPDAGSRPACSSDPLRA